MAWMGKGKSIHLQHITKGVWMVRRGGKLLPSFLLAFRRDHRAVWLYYPTPHATMLLTASGLWVRRGKSGRPARWKKLTSGQWIKPQARFLPPKNRAAMGPLIKKLTSFVSTSTGSVRPTSQPTSRATSRPSPQPTSRPGKPGKRVVARLHPTPRQMKSHLAWRSKDGKLHLQRVSPFVWRELREGRWTSHVFIHKFATSRSLLLWDPVRHVMLRLTGKQRSVQLTRRGKWHHLTKGSWSTVRLRPRRSWAAAGQFVRWQQGKGVFWAVWRKGKQQGLYRQVETTKHYIGLQNATHHIRLYATLAFARLRKASSAWKRLYPGHWESNPPLLSFVVPSGKQKPSVSPKRSAPAKRRAPARRVLPRQKAPPVPRVTPKRMARRKPPTRRVAADPRKRVSNTKRSPWRAVAFVRVELENGKKIYATGVLVGPRMVLTVAHILEHATSKVKSVKVYPGIHHLKTPFGAANAESWFVFPRWKTASKAMKAANDLGVLWLDRPLGAKKRALPASVGRLAQLRTSPLLLSGYPLDRFYKTKHLWQWFQVGSVVRTSKASSVITTSHRVFAGSFGSPLLLKTKAGWRVVGICQGSKAKKAQNLLLTKAQMRWIKGLTNRAKRDQFAKKELDKLPDQPPAGVRFWEGDGLDLEDLSK
jgi:V8-like Glu-specific endopeptidase